MDTVYLAGRYTRRAELVAYADELRALGYPVRARWLDGSHEWAVPGVDVATEQGLDNPDGLADRIPAEAFNFALDDLEDVRAADIVISFTERPRDPAASGSRGGRHVEFGLALAWAKRTIVVGWRENVFHLLPAVEHYGSWADALEALRSPATGLREAGSLCASVGHESAEFCQRLRGHSGDHVVRRSPRPPRRIGTVVRWTDETAAIVDRRG